jgi:midasin
MGLGFLHELHQEIYALAVAVQALQADRATVSRLARLERTSTSKRDSAVSATLQSVGNIVRAVIGQSEQLTLSPKSLGSLKSFFRWLAGSLQNLVNVSGRPDLDQALLNASFAIARDACTHSSTADIKELSLVIDIQQHLNTVARHDTKGWGSAMVSLWGALRPATPPTIDDLNDLLRLEDIVSQFDHTAQRFELPVEVIAGLRVSFARALGRAKAGGTDVDQLAEKLKTIMPSRNVDETEQSENASELEQPAPAKPHFAAVFSEIARHFDLLRLSGKSFDTAEQASLHVLAMQRTSNFILDVNASKSSSQWIFDLLGAVARPLSHNEENPSRSLSDVLLQHLTSRSAVSVNRLSLLESEMAILGRTLASETHLVITDVLPSLNEGLHQLLAVVLRTLAEHRDEAIRSMSQALYTIMESADLQALKQITASRKLPDELKGFVSSINYALSASTTASSPKAASQAWLNFATSCLRMYLPATQFDPALEPLLKRQVFDGVSADLAHKVSSLRNFTSALTGEQTSLRLRILEDDVNSLGSAPEAPSICRPPVSELADLQMDFDALRRILTTVEKDSTMILDHGLLINIQHIRKRLSEHYRAYTDLTKPVIGLLDCFDICNYLAQEDNSSEDGQQPGSKLQTVVPFFNASVADWSSDVLVNKSLPAAASQQETILWLAMIATRSCAWPLDQAKPELKLRVEQQFARLYDQWRTELGREQREKAANSNLYRYSGEDEMDDEPTAEELEELFPSADGEITSPKPSRSATQDLVTRIATLHREMFSGSKLTPDTAESLLNEFAKLSSKAGVGKDISLAMPMLLLQMQESAPKKHSNIYTDTNLDQIRKVLAIMRKTQERFNELHQAWPDHDTPMHILVICDQILAIEHTEPLVRFLPTIEKLHATVNEWQKIASREFTAITVLESLTDLIVSWRQLELSSWAGLFDEETRRTRAAATSWWFIAYETIIAATESLPASEDAIQQHVVGLIKALEDFFFNSGLGEYNTRLDLLRNFEHHLAARATESPAFAAVRQAMSNFVAYFSHYEGPVQDSLTAGRAALEKKIKETIQLASWKDRNIETLRQSAKTSHRKLFRLVKKFRVLLAQPVSQVLSAGIQSLPKELPSQVTAAQPTIISLDAAEEAALSSAQQSWAARPARFRNISATTNLIKSKSEVISWPQDAAQRLADFLDDVQESITELQKATPKILNEENKKLVNHLKTRKRRLLADVLKKIRAMGFQHNLSQEILDSQSSLSRALRKLGALDRDNARPVQKLSQSHLHKLLGLMDSVREGSRKHSDDLTPAEAARCAVYLESVLSMSTSQQPKLCQYSRAAQKLRSSMTAFESFSTCIQPASSYLAQTSFSLQQNKCMPTMLETGARLIRLQSQLASRNYQPVIDGLSQLAVDAQAFLNQMDRAQPLPTGVIGSEDLTVWLNTTDTYERASASVSAWMEAYPELVPTLSQMLKWLPSNSQRPCIDRSNPASADMWTAQIMEFLDKLLVSVQNLEKALPSTQPDENESAWLLRDEHQLESAWKALKVEQATKHIEQLLSQLQHAARKEEYALAALSTVCRSVFPLLHAFSAACEQVLSAYTHLHLRVNQMGHMLGTSFVILTKEGFCSPPEKSEDSKQDSGDVEAGTGLGDGEGGEDISKDIGDDEDLGELAQEKGKDREEEIEDQQDAVDMADQEMEGELGDAETGSQNEEDGDDQSDGDDLEEEEGKTGDLDDGAVDEKMWDDGKEKEEDKNEKETDSGKGTAQDQEMSAANEGEKEEGEDGEAGEDGEMDEEEQAAGPDEEEVSKKDTEATDPHMQEQENLDLPEDLNMEGDDNDHISEAGSMEPDDMPPDTGAEDEPAGEADQEQDEPEDAVQADSEEKEAEDDAMQTQEAGEEADAQDDPEVSDDEGHEDDNLLQNKDTDLDEVPEEGTTEGEQGAGKDEDEPQAQAAGGANDDNNETEPNEDAQAKQDSGAQSGANETEAEQPSEKSEQSAAAQSQSNYKQIGDVLEEWYKQQREIEAPTDSADAEKDDQQPQQDVDMANATFEHLPDANADADTQALGTASADQSGALNEETSKAVNEDKEMEDAPFQEMPEDDEEEQNDKQGDQGGDAQMEPSDQLPQNSDAKAFVGEQSNAYDIEMGEDGPTKEIDVDDEDDVEEMDDQLLRTHISREDGPEEMTIEEARQTWSAHEASTRNLSMILTEHLRLILQPTQATKMRGDFRTGKRLNIKRIIPYIASSYKRDKIWMRRSIPSKRNYQIMLAIDDSKSMDESDSKSLAFETLALVAKSMAMLEVGELCVLGFGEDVKVAHDFSTPFTSEAGAEVFKSFSFAQTTTNVHKLLKESIELFRAARLKAVGSSSELWQLQLIISDGVCENHPSIRQLVREAHEERIMIVFVVVDSASQNTGAGNVQGKGQSIVDLQRAEFVKDANGESQLNMVKYLDTFPFRYYLIVRDVQELPGVLAGALRQWFSEVVESGA